ncbi:MAG: hypothetical protein AAF682_23095 [Planctomycetota bacterium]
MRSSTLAPRVRRLAPLSAVLLTLVACGSESIQDQAPAPADEAEQAEQAPGLPVLLDDQPVARIPHDGLGSTPTSLVELLAGAAGDPAGWLVLEVEGRDGRGFSVNEPVRLHPDADLAVSLDDDGLVRVGLYAKAPPQRPRLLVMDALSVHARTTPVEVVERVPPTLQIQLVGGLPAPVEEEVLAALPRVEIAGGDGTLGTEEGGGGGDAAAAAAASARAEFLFAELLRPFAAPGTIADVRLSSRLGEVVVTGEHLVADDHDVRIKRNTRGYWKLTHAKPVRAESYELREVERIEIRLKDR